MKGFYFIVFILLFSSIYAQDKTDNYYAPPLNIPMFLAGNFGELRSNHFHSGIDIKTQGRTGLPVFAVADGYVSRITVSPWGFGNALYINHPNGTTTVYGHLKAFSDAILEYVKKEQYERESFTVDLSLSKDLFPVKKGQQIALSGNAGSSGGPHLHFEIRETKTQHPLNPLKYNFDIKDDISPKILSVLFYPVSDDAMVAGRTSSYRADVVFYNGTYHLKNNVVLSVEGTVGFGLQAIDYLDGSWNKCGIYSLSLTIDSVPVYSFSMDEFGFDETRYINSHIDYQQKIKYHRNAYKTWIEPGNELSIYNRQDGDGLFRFDDNKKHSVAYIVADVYGNQSVLKFKVLSKQQMVTHPKEEGTVFHYDTENTLDAKNIEVDFPEGCFYSDFVFKYDEKPAFPEVYSKVYGLHNKYTPVHKYFSVRIRPENLPVELQEKALLAVVNPENNDLSALGGSYDDGWVEGKIRKLGYVAVAVDTIAPSIYPLSLKNGRLTEAKRIRFRIKDDFSGIDTFRGTIDGKWVLFEYDAKNNLITYSFDKERFSFGENHELRLVVTDVKGNKEVYTSKFYK